MPPLLIGSTTSVPLWCGSRIHLAFNYYGLAYAFAFLTAALLLRLYWGAGRSLVDSGAQSDLMMAVIVGVMAGGRLGYFLLYSPADLIRNPLAVFRVWDGGMASHGGFVGVCLALLWFVRKHKLPWREVADILVTLAPPGLFFGRVANFINGELWGKVSYVRWAVIFPKSAPFGTPVKARLLRVIPSQLSREPCSKDCFSQFTLNSDSGAVA